MEQEINYRKIIYSIFIVSITLIVLIGITYAYFAGSVSSNTNSITSTETIAINYSENKDYMFSDLIPSTLENALIGASKAEKKCMDDNNNYVCSLYEFTVDNISNVSQDIEVYLYQQINGYTNLKYEVYGTSINDSNFDNEHKVVNSTSLVYPDFQNELGTKIDGLTKTLNKVDNSVTTDSVTYTLMFYVENKDYNQSGEDGGKQIVADIHVVSKASGLYTIGSFGSECWTNEGETLTAFNGINEDGSVKNECTGYVSRDVDTYYNISIPSSVNGTPITTLGPNLFNIIVGTEIDGEGNPNFILNNYQYIKSITIAEGITTIADGDISMMTGDGSNLFGSFMGTGISTNGMTISLPNSLINIGNDAFLNSGLSNVKIPANVTRVGSWAFMANDYVGINKLTTVIFLGTRTNDDLIIDRNAFQCVSDSCALTSITLPDNLTTIGLSAFNGTSISTITIPKSVVTIGVAAFYRTNLSTITFEGATDGTSNLTKIGGDAFSETNLSTITIPKSVVTIGDYAFYKTNLSTITIPKSVVTIGDSAFRYIETLTTVTFEGATDGTSNLTTISDSAFYNCNLTYNSQENPLIIPASVTSIEYYAFDNDNNTNNPSLNYIRPMASIENRTGYEERWYNSNFTVLVD